MSSKQEKKCVDTHIDHKDEVRLEQEGDSPSQEENIFSQERDTLPKEEVKHSSKEIEYLPDEVKHSSKEIEYLSEETKHLPDEEDKSVIVHTQEPAKIITVAKVVLEKILALLEPKEMFILSSTNKVLGQQIFSIPKSLKGCGNTYSLLELGRLFARYPQAIIASIAIYVHSESSFSAFVDEVPGLTNLRIVSEDSDCDEKFLSSISKLKSLHTLETGIVSGDLEVISECPSLTNLTLENISNSCCLYGVDRCSKLKKLCLDECTGVNDLKQIRNMPCLEELEVSGTEILFDFPPFKGCPSLTNLKFSSCNNLHSLDSLSTLITLKSLEICCCSNISDISFISKCIYLEKIVLACVPVDDLTPLVDCPLVAEISLMDCEEVNDVPNLSEFKHLCKLELTDCSNLFFDEKIPNIEVVRITDFPDGFLPIPSSICPVLGINRLKVLDLSFFDDENVLDISSLGTALLLEELSLFYNIGLPSNTNRKLITGTNSLLNCTKLKIFKIKHFKLDDLTFLSNSLLLEELFISNIDMKVFKGIEGCFRLKSFTIFNSICLENLDPFINFKDLETCHITECRNLNNIIPLGKCTKLSHLTVEKCRLVKDISMLFNCRNLTQVNISNTFRITDLSVAKFWPKLSRFSARNCKSISSIEPLRNCRKMLNLDMEGCCDLLSLDPLSEMKKLISLDISGCINLDDISVISKCEHIFNLNLSRIPTVDIGFLRYYYRLSLLNLVGCVNIIGLEKLQCGHTMVVITENDGIKHMRLRELQERNRKFKRGNPNITIQRRED
jgi:hypothetical protein